MKKHLFLTLLACSLMAAAHAQTPQNLNNEAHRIYFSIGKSELTQAQQQQLDIVANLVLTQPESTVELQGFADETGAAEKNKLLAQQRAHAAQSYLRNKGIKAERILVLPAIVQGSGDEKERKVLVNIYVDGKKKGLSPINNNNYNSKEQKALENIQNFANYWAEDMAQTQTIDPQKANIIYGKKGALVHIPPQALVNAKGEIAKGEIVVTLQEAHTYGDMLLQNWATSAQGKQLETGGMIAIFAKNEAGEDLEVAQGQKLTVSLPNQNAKAPDMELFVGKIDQNTKAVDWHATNQPVANTSTNVFDTPFESSNMEGGDRFGTLTNWNDSTLIKARELKRNCEVFTTPYTATVAKPKPNKLKAPTPPVLVQVEDLPKKQTKIDLGKTNPQEGSETKAEYQKRLQKIYDQYNAEYSQQRATYLDAVAKNKAEQAKYDKAEREYNSEVARFERENAKYSKYMADLRLRMELVATWAGQFDLQQYNTQVRKANDELTKIANPNYTSQKIDYLNNQYTVFSAQNESMRPLWQTAKANFMQATMSAQKQAELEKLNKELYKIYTTIITTTDKISQNSRSKRAIRDDFKETILMQAQKLNAKQNWTAKDCAQAKKLFDKTKARPMFATLQRQTSRYTKFMADNDALLAEAFAKQEILNKEYATLMAKKTELGLLTAAEIAETYKNSMSIASLGNINCDKFYEDDAPKGCMDILVDAKQYNNSNTQFYVVFEDIQSIMPASQVNNMFKIDKIPLNRNVKIVGISVTGKTAEIFITKGTVRDFVKNKIRPTFEPKTLEEVKNIMKSV
jgi:hypothetical protein